MELRVELIRASSKTAVSLRVLRAGSDSELLSKACNKTAVSLRGFESVQSLGW